MLGDFDLFNPGYACWSASAMPRRQEPFMAAIRNMRIGVSVSVAAVVAVVLLLVPSSLLAEHEEHMVASEPSVAGTCAACHDAIVQQYGTTRHGKADQFGLEGYGSCASCHGDVAAHAESADPTKIFNPGKASLAESSAKCLNCHGNEHQRIFWEGGLHEASNVGCLSCHSVHHAKSEEKLLVRRSENLTCLACHVEQRKAMTQRSTHFFRDELQRATMQCSGCHNAHGSQTERMLRENSLNDTCLRCHTEKRGPFLWEHAPVQESCLNCHSPHGSNNINLLSLRAPQLCQTCHMQGKHQTVSGFANSPWVLNRACLNCHSQIHGSNHPSGLKLHQ